MVRVIICDDDPVFADALKQSVAGALSDLGIPAKIHLYDSLEKIGAPILSSCDIAFLDIDFNHPNYNGFDVARKLRTVRKDAIIIFVTNYIEYAPEGYEVQAFRYVLKKDHNKKIREYISEAIKQLEKSRQTLKITINGEIIDLPLNSILYIESNLRMVIIHTQKGNNKKQYAYYAAISDLEKKLEPWGFFVYTKVIWSICSICGGFSAKRHCLRMERFCGSVKRITQSKRKSICFGEAVKYGIYYYPYLDPFRALCCSNFC